MVYSEQTKAEGPQWLNVFSFGTTDNHGNSECTDQHPDAFPSSNIIDQAGQTSLPIPDVLVTLCHDVPA